MQVKYIYPLVKKEVTEQEDFKVYEFSTDVRIPIEGIYNIVHVKKRKSIVKSDYNIVNIDQFLLQLSEDFHTEVYKLINFHEGFKEPLSNVIDKVQTSEKDRLKLLYN